MRVALDNYRQDLASGHITVLSEMIAGSLTHGDLASQVLARMQPWIDFAEETIRAVLSGSIFDGLLSEKELAFAVVAFYLGIDLLAHLDPDRPEPEALFVAAQRLAPLFGANAGA